MDPTAGLEETVVIILRRLETEGRAVAGVEPGNFQLWEEEAAEIMAEEAAGGADSRLEGVRLGRRGGRREYLAVAGVEAERETTRAPRRM